MILSDTQILEYIEAGDIKITPFDRKNLGSNSYDLHLSEHIACYTTDVLDAKKDNELDRVTMTSKGNLIFPNKLYLMSTIEYTESYNCVPFIDGKSSIGRLGMSIHLTAGVGDNGFCGHWTLEVTVEQPLIIYPGMPVAQIYWFKTGICKNSYDKKTDSKYSKQAMLPQGSKMFKNFI